MSLTVSCVCVILQQIYLKFVFTGLNMIFFKIHKKKRFLNFNLSQIVQAYKNVNKQKVIKITSFLVFEKTE